MRALLTLSDLVGGCLRPMLRDVEPPRVLVPGDGVLNLLLPVVPLSECGLGGFFSLVTLLNRFDDVEIDLGVSSVGVTLLATL